MVTERNGQLEFRHGTVKLTSLENTPRNTGDQVVDEQMFNFFGGDGNGDHDSEHDEGTEDDFFVAETFGDETVERETENFTAIGGLEEVVSIR